MNTQKQIKRLEKEIKELQDEIKELKLAEYINNAIIKFNNGQGALLCNKCKIIIAYGFKHKDKKHYCIKCKGSEA